MTATTNGAGNQNNLDDQEPGTPNADIQTFPERDFFKEMTDAFCALFDQNFQQDIDPLRDQAADIGRVASLGLEDTSDVEDIVREIDGEEDTGGDWDEFDIEADEESRKYPFTAEDIGLFISRKDYQLTCEQAWAGIELHHEAMTKIQDKVLTGRNYVMAIESAGAIDRMTAEAIKNDFPSIFDNLNLKSFTSRPSKINYNIAREEMSSQQLALTGAAAAGGIFLVYKLLSWGSNILSNNPAATNSIRKNMGEAATRGQRIKEDTRNIQDIMKDIENGDKKLASLIREQNGQEIIRNLGSADLQKVIDVKWSVGKEFQPLCNSFMRTYIEDDGSKTAQFGGNLEALAAGLKDAIENVMTYIESAANADEGQSIDYTKISGELDGKAAFINAFISKMDVNVPNDVGNVEKVRQVANWFNNNLTPIEDWKPDHAPSADMIAGFGVGAFEQFDTSLADNMSKAKDRLKTILANNKANKKEADNKNQSFKVISDAYVALNSLLRAIIKFRNWLGQLSTKQNTFLGNVLSVFK